MSYTEITGFDTKGVGCSIDTFEIRNAFRGAMAIWTILEKKYLPEYIPEYAKTLSKETRIKLFPDGFSRMIGINDDDSIKELWELSYNKKVLIEDRIVLMSTFDKVLVKKKNFNKLVEAFERFEGETSLKEQSEIIKNLEEYITAIGFNQTSVCCNRWYGYNFNKNNDHWWLFDRI